MALNFPFKKSSSVLSDESDKTDSDNDFLKGKFMSIIANNLINN